MEGINIEITIESSGSASAGFTLYIPEVNGLQKLGIENQV
jgi:hypothetical protein